MLDVGSIFGYNSSGVQLKKWYMIDNIPHLLKVDTGKDEANKEVYASKLAKAFGLYCVDSVSYTHLTLPTKLEV